MENENKRSYRMERDVHYDYYFCATFSRIFLLSVVSFMKRYTLQDEMLSHGNVSALKTCFNPQSTVIITTIMARVTISSLRISLVVIFRYIRTLPIFTMPKTNLMACETLFDLS